MSFCNDSLLIDFFTLLKMVMPTGIIIVSSKGASNMNSSFVYHSVIKICPGLKLSTQNLLERAFPSQMVTKEIWIERNINQYA